MGIKNFVQSRRILLMAKGRSKAQIVQRSLYGSVTPKVPSSVLQLHPDLIVILDEEAAREIGRNRR
jgi:glucosamine-6-phosphate deaminase